MPLIAQNGFIKTYRHLDTVGMGYFNMILTNDTLITFGGAFDTTQNLWGLKFSVIDTLGNLKSEQLFSDSTNINYLADEGYELIKTIDGGYAANGVNFNSRNAVIVKLDSNFNIQFVKEYPDPPPNVRTTLPRGIVETPGGYLISGVKQRIDFLHDIYVMKVDKSGEFQWQKFYGKPGLAESGNIDLKIDQNNFLIGGSIGFQEGPKHERWFRSWIFNIDSLGNIISDWKSEEGLENTEFGGSNENILLENGDQVLLASIVVNYDVDFFETTTQGRIMCIDSNFNKKWEYIAGVPSGPFNGLSGMTQTQDGGYVSVGQYFTNITGFDGLYVSHMVKVDANGNFLWERTDTVNPHPTNGSINYATQVVELSSGSLMVCGTGEYRDSGPNRYSYSFGYLIKTDRHGCLQPDCRTSNTSETIIKNDGKIYPNPTSGVVTFEQEKDEPRTLKVFDMNGKLLAQKKLLARKSVINMNGYASGTYILQIFDSRDRFLEFKRIVIQK